MKKEARILVASATTTDAGMIRDLLMGEFGAVSATGHPDRLVEVFDREAPDVVIFAFPSLKSAERYYLGLLRRSVSARQKPHRTVLLCHRDEVAEAYHLCRRQHFDDYVVFWPVSYDPHRLSMVVHHAVQAVVAADEHGAHSGVFAFLAHAGASADAPEAPEPPAPAADGPGASGTVHVLLLDDDTFQHKLVAGALVGTEFRLTAVATPEDFFRQLATSAPDVVLMDFQLPDTDGIKIVRQMRQDPALREVPVVMVTGHSTREIAMRSLAAGAHDFIVKPFDRFALAEKLRAALPANQVPGK